MAGPSSSRARWVITNDGSISPFSIRSKKLGQVVLDGRLSHAERQSAIDRRAHRDLVEIAAVHADDRDDTEVAAALDRLSQHVRAIRSEERRDLDAVQHGIGGRGGRGLRSDGVDAGVGAAAMGQLLNALVDVVLLEVDASRRLHPRPAPSVPEPCRSRSLGRPRGGTRCEWRIVRRGRNPRSQRSRRP